MLVAAGVGQPTDIERARATAQGFGRFVRSLVGLDRKVAVGAFSEFVADESATADQIEFIDMIVEHLTERGVMEPRLLYESPFTDVAPSGPEQVFDLRRADRLVEIIHGINESAVA